jgi:pimeloyl-ACP methyl ester carboxylesterase
VPEIIVGGDRIHYAAASATDPVRPTVLMIHGAGQSIATWRNQLELLRDDPRYNVIALDLPGHGSSEGEGFRNAEGYKGFIGEFARALGLGEIIPVGHSMGGAVAMLYALDNPENVRALGLVGTGARMRVSPETLKTVKSDYKLFCDVSPGRMIAESSPDEVRREFRQGLLQTSPEVCYWDLVACDEFDIMDRVHEIKAPAFIVSAELDLLTPPKYGEYLNSSISGSIYHLINGSGHFMMLEKPLEFNEILSRFLTNISA